MAVLAVVTGSTRNRPQPPDLMTGRDRGERVTGDLERDRVAARRVGEPPDHGSPANASKADAAGSASEATLLLLACQSGMPVRSSPS